MLAACDGVLAQCGGTNTPKCSCNSKTGNCVCTGEGCNSVCTCKDRDGTTVCKWVQNGSHYACSCTSDQKQKIGEAQLEY